MICEIMFILSCDYLSGPILSTTYTELYTTLTNNYLDMRTLIQVHFVIGRKCVNIELLSI